MPEEQLNNAEVLRTPIDQGRLCSAQRVGAIGSRIEADFFHPTLDDPRVLTCRKMKRRAKSAGKQEILLLQSSSANPCAQSVPRLFSDFELHGPLGLLLHNDGPCRNTLTVSDVPDTEFHEVTPCNELPNMQ
jgi:hypothetical protein